MIDIHDRKEPRVYIQTDPAFEFNIFLPGPPISWKRPGKNGTASYDTQAKEKLYYGLKLKKYWPGEPLKGPIAVHLEFRLKPSQQLRQQYGKALEDREQFRVPDIDNFAKFIIDAFTPVAWKDDCQIAVLNCRKCYSFEPGTQIRIFSIPTLLGAQNTSQEVLGD